MQQENSQPISFHPAPEVLLRRLHEVDVEQFNSATVANELKGQKAWLFVMVMPISAVLLVTITLAGTFITDHLIGSFIAGSVLIFLAGKMLEQYEQQFKVRAYHIVIGRIAETEGDYGLLFHFKDFLPKKYRHLCKSLKRKEYHYIHQYITATYLLQQKLNPQKFTHIWYMKHPELAPEGYFDESDEDEDEDMSDKLTKKEKH